MRNMYRKNDNVSICRGKLFLKFLAFFHLLLFFFNITFFDVNNIIAKEVKGAEIKDIEISDYNIKIRVDGPINYRLYKALDPFTAILEIEGVELGKYTHRIFSKKPGISELKPSQLTSPALIARFEILLSEPADVVPQIKEGTLILNIKAEQAIQQPIFTPPKGASKIISIRFEKTADSLEVSLKGDGIMPDPQTDETESSITVFLPKIKMATSIPKQIPPPIREIQYSEEEQGLKIKFDFDRKIDSLAFAFDEELIIDIPYKNKIEKIEPPPTLKEEAKKEPAKEVQPSILPVQQAVQEKLNLMTLDFQDADIVAILRILAEVSGKNIIIHPDVKGKISMKLVNIPWEQALDVVLKTNNLIKVEEGNVIMVQPYTTFTKAGEEFAKAKDTQKLLEPLQIKTYQINYADIFSVEEAIKEAKILTARGTLSIMPSPAKDLKTQDPVDKFTSGEAIGTAGGREKVLYRKRGGILIVKDVPSVFPPLDKLIAELDRPNVQFQIQARIVELSTEYERDLGIQWGLTYNSPNTLWSIGGPNPLTDNKFIVDFPANPDTRIPINVGTGFTFGLMNPAGTLSLDLKLSAIEQANKGRVISTPRLLTVEKQKARIMQGFSIPYISEVTKEGTASVDFKDVAIIIEVTPHITEDNKIILDVITIKEDLVTFIKVAGADAPFTRKVEGNTRVIMNDGETFVIGGIYQKSDRDKSEGVPGLMHLPVLGWLFKNKQVIEDIREMIIFITPRILDKPIAKR